MRTTEKIRLLEKLLEKHYPAEVYDKSAKNSIFRLRAERVIAYLNKVEMEVYNHE